MIRHNPEPPSAVGNTGRYPEGLELPPVIDPQTAEWDRLKFLQAGEADRKRRKRLSSQLDYERRRAA